MMLFRSKGWAAWAGLALTVGGASVAAHAASTNTAPPLTLDAAIAMALDHDLSVQLAKLNLQSAEISYQRSEAQNLLQGTQSSRIQAETGHQTAELSYAQSRNNLVSSVIDEAFALRIARDNATVAKEQLQLDQDQLQTVIQEEKTGAAQALDELSARASVAGSQASLSKAQDALTQAENDVRRSLGLTGDAAVSFAELPAFAAFAVPNDAATKAQSVSSDVIQATANVKLQELALSQAQASGSAGLDLSQAQNALAIADLKLKQTRSSLEDSVNSAISGLEQSAAQYNVAVLQEKLAAQRHDIYAKQAAAGLKTHSDLLSDQISLEKSDIGELSALRSYEAALVKLKALLGMSLAAESPTTNQNEAGASATH